MNNLECAEALKNAFFEGYNSYSTPCSAYNTADEAWEESSTKLFYDSLVETEN